MVYRNATDTKCSQMVASMIKNKDEQQVLFMGDSTMHMLYEEARAFQSGEMPSSKIIKNYQVPQVKSFWYQTLKSVEQAQSKKGRTCEIWTESPGVYRLQWMQFLCSYYERQAIEANSS